MSYIINLVKSLFISRQRCKMICLNYIIDICKIS